MKTGDYHLGVAQEIATAFDDTHPMAAAHIVSDLIERHTAPLRNALANLVAAEKATKESFTAKEIDALEKAMAEATAALRSPNTKVSQGPSATNNNV